MNQSPVFIISGTQGEGKTTLLKEVISELRKSEISIAGFYAEGSWKNDQRDGFHLVDILSQTKKVLCTSEFQEGFEQLGRFYFDRNIIRWGKYLLELGIQTNASLFVIDEMGKFEMKGKVWHDPFFSLQSSGKPLLITVRSSLVEELADRFNIPQPVLFRVGQSSADIAERIISFLK